MDNKLHVFDLKDLTWSVADAVGDIPPPRVGVTMAAIGTTIYIFGGRDLEHKELNELYSFDACTNVWTLLSSDEVRPTGATTPWQVMSRECTSLVGAGMLAG